MEGICPSCLILHIKVNKKEKRGLIKGKGGEREIKKKDKDKGKEGLLWLFT
jgi:hypothetical protein